MKETFTFYGFSWGDEELDLQVVVDMEYQPPYADPDSFEEANGFWDISYIDITFLNDLNRKASPKLEEALLDKVLSSL